MENSKVVAERGAAGERQSARSAATEAGLRALIADPEWHKSDGSGVWRADYERAAELVVEAALPQLVPTREQIADALHAAREGEMGCERKDPRQCLYWHEEAERADVVLALLIGVAK